jgi:hypothetical protein
VRTLVPLQVAAGGVLHVGWVVGMVHTPPPQVPAVYVRRVVPFAQSGEGGVLQLTPAQGSGLHCESLHPKGHVVSLVV